MRIRNESYPLKIKKTKHMTNMKKEEQHRNNYICSAKSDSSSNEKFGSKILKYSIN